MTPAERELLVARICSGVTRLRLSRKRTYLVAAATPLQRYLAQEVYFEQLEAGQKAELFSEEELYDHLLSTGQWDDERASLLKNLPREIDEFKLKLWKASFRSSERAVVRAALAVAKDKLAQLEAERHAWDFLSAAGAASLARSRYLLGVSLRHTDGRPVFTDSDFWAHKGSLLERAMRVWMRLRISEPEYRELARTDPWRSIYGCRKAETSLFGVPASQYSEEQRTLAAVSGLYESVHEHPDCPADDVLADDDMFDGWLIDQKRQQDARRGARQAENAAAGANKHDEVYLVVDTAEDARKVMSMNDEHGSATQRQRFAVLRKQGEVNEADMPDTKLRRRTEATQRMLQATQQRT